MITWCTPTNKQQTSKDLLNLLNNIGHIISSEVWKNQVVLDQPTTDFIWPISDFQSLQVYSQLPLDSRKSVADPAKVLRNVVDDWSTWP